MLQPGQKSVNLQEGIVCKFLEPGDLVRDACYGATATGRACLLQPLHHRFVGCEMREIGIAWLRQ